MCSEADGAAVDEERFPGRQARLVFAYLVLEQGKPVPREVLAEAVWGERPPPSWEKGLTVIVSKLRALLTDAGLDGPRLLTSAFGCYRLDLPDGAWVDVRRRTERGGGGAARARRGRCGASPQRGRRGGVARAAAFLPGEDRPWVDERRRDLSAVLSAALLCLGDVAVRTGRPGDAVRYAEEALELEPFRESGYRRLMEAYAAAGDRAESLRVYERCRRLLADELGAYPSPETEAAYRALLGGVAEPGSGGTPPAEREPAPPPATQRSRRPVLVALAALLLAPESESRSP